MLCFEILYCDARFEITHPVANDSDTIDIFIFNGIFSCVFYLS